MIGFIVSFDDCKKSTVSMSTLKGGPVEKGALVKKEITQNGDPKTLLKKGGYAIQRGQVSLFISTENESLPVL